jgi:group I intron endonuclease
MGYGVIYLITNKINGKVYVGQTTENVPEDRWDKHISKAKCKSTDELYYFGRAIKKYGSENFTFEIIKGECTDEDDLTYWEIYYVNFYDSMNREKGYNTREPGSRGKHTEETKEKLRIANTGKILTDEHKKKLSLAHTGKKLTEQCKAKMSAVRKGRPLSAEHCEAISTGRTGIKFSEEHKKNMSLVRSGENSSTAKLTWEQVRAIREEYAGGNTSIGELSEKYNSANILSIIDNTIWIDPNYDCSQAEKIKEINKIPSGERNSQCKHTWEEIKALRAESDTDPSISYTKLGEKYNMGRVSAMLILKNRTWIDENYVPVKGAMEDKYSNKVQKSIK